jgi:hypothetical protein
METKRDRTNSKDTKNLPDDETDTPGQSMPGRPAPYGSTGRSPPQGSDRESGTQSLQPDWRSNSSNPGTTERGKSDTPNPAGGPGDKMGESPTDANRMGGGSRKEGQVPYGSQPPRREGGSDEGRAASRDAHPSGQPTGPSRDSNDPSSPNSSDEAETGNEAQSKDNRDRTKKPTDGRGDHPSDPGSESKAY